MLWQQRGESPAMGLRRLRCAGPCACGAALVVLVVPSLRFALASQAGLVIGWRAATMPSSILAWPWPERKAEMPGHAAAAGGRWASPGTSW